VVEGSPPALDSSALLGFGYLALVGTALAHVLWFRGVIGLAPTRVTMLALLSPVVATIMGWIVLGQALSGWQLGGAVLVLGAIVLGASRPSTADSEISTVRLAPARRSRWIGGAVGVYSVASSPGHRGR
jgi:probable blue pigment (indigoidine) exporter